MTQPSAARAWDAADAAAEAIAAAHARAGGPIVAGLAGAQGSGKSTMAPRLRARLAGRGLRAAVLSLDDFYRTLAERRALARSVHPLLATRGVPGTHDLALLNETLDRLLAGPGPVPVPRFDKVRDDRGAPARLPAPCDVVLLEGWCVGARPQPAADLATPVNALEALEDPDGSWRRWVNDRLATDYAALFARLDLTIMLRAPDFGVVAQWRGEQERALGSDAMRPEALARFIAHYERITRWMLEDRPADLVIELDETRTPRL